MNLAHRLLHIRVQTLRVLQLVVWVCLMVVATIHPHPFTSSLLYTVQISHWALVLSCGTAATATWGLIATRGHHEQAKVEWNKQELDLDAIEQDIGRLAELPKCPEGDALAVSIQRRLHA